MLYDKNKEVKTMTNGIDPAMVMALSGNKGGLFGGDGGGMVGGLILGSLISGNNGGGIFGNNGNNGNSSTTAVTTDLLLQPLISGVQSQISNLSAQVCSNASQDLITDSFSNVMSGQAGIQSNLSNVTRDLSASIASVNSNLATANFTTLSSINALGRDNIITSNNVALQQLNSFNQLQTSINQGLNEIGRDQNIATNQIIAGQNAQAFAMAQCCCDIKNAICHDGAETRALINQNTMNELTSQLTDAKLANSNLNQTNALINNNATQTGIILQHLARPCHPVVS
jgi:hypothetical protein